MEQLLCRIFILIIVNILNMRSSLKRERIHGADEQLHALASRGLGKRRWN